MRAIDVPELEEYIVDMYHELHENTEYREVSILFEGAQGFGLDIDWGDYPFVTSSHCTVGGAILNGVPPKSIRDIWGVAKIYETYVGAKTFEGTDEAFPEIRRIGDEFGATTGRPRQVNWMDFDLLQKAININGSNKVVINKMDILDKVGKWRLYSGLNLFEFENSEDMQLWISEMLEDKGVEVVFSRHKDRI